jgi:hypothetical protein
MFVELVLCNLSVRCAVRLPGAHSLLSDDGAVHLQDGKVQGKDVDDDGKHALKARYTEVCPVVLRPLLDLFCAFPLPRAHSLRVVCMLSQLLLLEAQPVRALLSVLVPRAFASRLPEIPVFLHTAHPPATLSAPVLQTVSYGTHIMSAWYHSPLPCPFDKLKQLYVCPYTLKYFRKRRQLQRHMLNLPSLERRPPGARIYQSPPGGRQYKVSTVDKPMLTAACDPPVRPAASLQLDRTRLIFATRPHIAVLMSTSYFHEGLRSRARALVRPDVSRSLCQPC